MTLRHSRSTDVRSRVAAFLLATVCSAIASAQADVPTRGPETESRFPPLVLAPGFKATLFACDPLVEYPSVIARGPRPGSVFVAHDYLTGLGTEIVRRDEVRLLADTDGDGYADRSTLFAGGFNSIQGLLHHAGTLFVMHAPLLSALRDADGDGIAEERRDLLSGLGISPEENSTRLHCANGVAAGHDGWLYLALGDYGANIPRPEGDRLVLRGGGIARCRLDGHDAHVFSTGLRNIYDIALDEELNVFVRDNENDGGDYLLRVCRSFHGADHGYPYLYHEHPDEALAPLVELGRGSSAGGTCYLETAFPPEFRGNLIFCEWGRSLVRYERRREGCHFAPMRELELGAGAANDPYGFKPTDAVVDHDGSLLVSDWGDGQRPKRGRGRIYRITHSIGNPTPASAQSNSRDVSLDEAFAALDSPGYLARAAAQSAIERAGAQGQAKLREAWHKHRLGTLGRFHAIWGLANVSGAAATDELFAIAATDPEGAVRAQAVRALADITDPILVEHRVDCGRGAEATAVRIARLLEDTDPRVVLEAVVALGRLKWPAAPRAIRDRLAQPDPTMAHAIMQALRRCDDWLTMSSWLDEPDDSPWRQIALRAIADQAVSSVVDGLLARLESERDPGRKRQLAELLTRVQRRRATTVPYWGYRPPPRPPNTETWERSEAIAIALDRALGDPNHEFRVHLLSRMQREQVPVKAARLGDWLREDRDSGRVDSVLGALATLPHDETRWLLDTVIRDRTFAVENRLRAFSLFRSVLEKTGPDPLLGLVDQVEEGPVLEQLVVELGKHPQLESRRRLMERLDARDPRVRAAAIGALEKLGHREAASRVVALLGDPDPRVRKTAASAAAAFSISDSADTLLGLARDVDPAVQSAGIDALRRLHDPRGIAAAVDSLAQPATQGAALAYLAELGGLQQRAAISALAGSTRSIEALTGVVRTLATWSQKCAAASPEARELETEIAKVQGVSGSLLRWHTHAADSAEDARRIREAVSSPDHANDVFDSAAGWESTIADSVEERIRVVPTSGGDASRTWLAITDIWIPDATDAQFLGSSAGTFAVWLDGERIHERDKPGAFQPESDRFRARLKPGMNRIAIQIDAAKGTLLFQLRFRRSTSSADQERLAQAALEGSGSVERGKQLFANPEKSLCMKCHRMRSEGGAIGPDLTGIGSRFSKIHLIESILEPSRAIAPSYETITVALSSGRVLSGVKVAETPTMLALGDDQGKTHEILKSEIEERVTQAKSTMPDGLEKRLTDREFVDLVTFLASEKKTQP